MTQVSAWGRLSADTHHLLSLNDPNKIRDLICHAQFPGLAHGMGRSYGDACLNPGGLLWLTTGLDHFIHFDEGSGCLTCEAGVQLRDIQQLMIPRGWILPVSPGTQMVTVGGAIANDVHGKNHHMLGTFGDHVRRIKLLRTDGEIIVCSPTEKSDWFAATVGGLGLTGLIVEAELQLRPVIGPWLDTETIHYNSLEEFFHLADASEANWEHTVSWVDCMSGAASRGIFMRANPGGGLALPEPKSGKRSMPFTPPVSLVNRLSLRPFNFAYYYLKKWQAGKGMAHYQSFFYPLDNLLEWNRMYGPKGFFQYQSVVARDVGQAAIQDMLKEIARSGDGSFLAVLKTFGNRQPVGMLSFAQAGVTLALDFPNHGERTHQLFERLDAIVREAGGRIYPAKDARMPRELFEAGYPRLHEFLKYRDPGISSGLSRRLMGS
ncbi:FAD-binding protein [Undibacterium sp. JH2W]|uniref:FAD-binding oxidoreductase n=1 Tax=Undibacterium sp. JH2W TaxID=3413037 RepID=UPI003BF2D780